MGGKDIAAFFRIHWLCVRCKDYSANNDVWNVHWRWTQSKPQLQAALLAGTYRFRPAHHFCIRGHTVEVWRAQDALVLKALALVLTHRLAPQLSEHCYHLAGRGGAKAAVRAVAQNLDQHSFVFRSDVWGYYAAIDHDVLLALVKTYVADPRILDLLWAYMRRSVYDDGLYRDITRGISLGCPLSPLMGALYLQALDETLAVPGLFYARFMDDWVVLSPTRWKLRAAVKQANQILVKLIVEKHPNKTFVGRPGSAAWNAALTSWAIASPRRDWRSRWRRYGAFWNAHPGFTIKGRATPRREPPALGCTSSAGTAGPTVA